MERDPRCVREMENVVDACTVNRRLLRDDFFFPLHWHNYFEFEILLSGIGEHVCNGRRYQARAGDCWLMSLYDFHSFSAREETEMLHVCFERGYLSVELEGILSAGDFCCRLEGDAFFEACEICNRLMREQAESVRYFKMSQKAMIERLLILMLRASNEKSEHTSSPIAEAISYMHGHFREELTLEEVARRQNLSPNYFGNCFKKSVGSSFREYLNKIRLKYACQLLTASHLSVKEIAFASGYSSVEYFFYVFKKQLSTTPAEYRRGEARMNA